jgi:hypothetical protein
MSASAAIRSHLPHNACRSPRPQCASENCEQAVQLPQARTSVVAEYLGSATESIIIFLVFYTPPIKLSRLFFAPVFLPEKTDTVALSFANPECVINAGSFAIPEFSWP